MWINKSEVQPWDVESSQSEILLQHHHYYDGGGGGDDDDGHNDTQDDLTGFAKVANKESLWSRVSKEPARDTFYFMVSLRFD